MAPVFSGLVKCMAIPTLLSKARTAKAPVFSNAARSVFWNAPAIPEVISLPICTIPTAAPASFNSDKESNV